MEKWFKKNLKYVAILFIALFLIKSIQSCNRKMSLRIVEKNLTIEKDSLLNEKDNIIAFKDVVVDSLNTEILTKDFIINDLTNELKIAGVKVDAADKRADAVQRTAEKIRTNTTIEIKGAERDTTKNIR
jgi:hypothetical protein